MTTKARTGSRRGSHDWTTDWNNSLEEIGYLLPMSGTASGRGRTKKETLIDMLQYFDFLQGPIQSLQNNLPPHCLPQVNDREESESEPEDTPQSEPSTSPHLLKAKRKYSCAHSRKNPKINRDFSDHFDDRNHTLHKEDPDRNGAASTNHEHPPTRSAEESSRFIDDSDSNTQPDSLASTDSLKVLLQTAASSSSTGSGVDQESPCQGLGSHCSDCEDRTGSEDGSTGCKDLDTPPSGSFLLKDRMFGILPFLENKHLPSSPTLPQMPILPLFPLPEGLNLSPSLLTSPARGLSHPLLPNGQQELQTLFEDVWVTPNPNVLKAFSVACKFTDDVHCQYGSGGCVSSLSEEDDRGSVDMKLTPKQCIPIWKASRAHRRKFFRKKNIKKVINNSLKKKCVNGFIMFCRMNRRLYLRTHPGTPSTVVTKELANLWHIMPKQERHLYCLKARRFSRLQNRNVRSAGQEAESQAEREAEDCVPSPLHMLLAHRDIYFASRGKS